MNISPINNQTNNTNFRALKNIEFTKKLSKNSKAQEKLLDAIQINSSLQNFCKKFEVNLVFDAFEDGYNRGVSRMAVIYKDLPDKSKTFFETVSASLQIPSLFLSTALYHGSVKKSTVFQKSRILFSRKTYCISQKRWYNILIKYFGG